MADAAALIGVDWGTTNLRAFAIDADGTMIARRSRRLGVTRLNGSSYGSVLHDIISDWRAPDIPVLVCGMVGSRHGWLETGYRTCPVGPADLALEYGEPEAGVRIVPGVSLRNGTRLADVMRGEDVQVLGAFEPGRTAVAVCPGTHSKWIHLSGGRITGFKSFMTGELFALLKSHSVLGRDMTASIHDPEAFDAGVRQGLNDPTLSSALFSTRVGLVDGHLTPGSAEDYMSGILIGAEVAGAGEAFGTELNIIGAPDLAGRYRRALEIAGLTSAQIVDPDAATVRGLWRIWKEAPA